MGTVLFFITFTETEILVSELIVILSSSKVYIQDAIVIYFSSIWFSLGMSSISLIRLYKISCFFKTNIQDLLVLQRPQVDKTVSIATCFSTVWKFPNISLLLQNILRQGLHLAIFLFFIPKINFFNYFSN